MCKFKIIIILSAFFSFQTSHAQDLIETFQLALDNDPQYKSAYYNQYATAEIKSQSIAQMLPNISLSGSSARQRLNNKKFTFQGSGTQNFWNHSFNICLYFTKSGLYPNELLMLLHCRTLTIIM